MTKDEALEELDSLIIPRDGKQDKLADAFDMAIEALKQELCDDCISRQAVIDSLHSKFADGFDSDRWWNSMSVLYAINKVPPVNPQPKTEQFAKWVATEIFDDNWEYNKDAFGELACRKLAKLGIVRAKGDEWELVEPQERSDK